MRDDFKQLLGEWLNDEAENHLRAWGSRYEGKSKKDVETDLRVNHDDSDTIERVEDELGRKLTQKEMDVLQEKFIKAVLRNYKRERT